MLGRDDGQSRMEEVHAQLKLQADFYAGDGMVAFTNPVWIQTTFGMLMGIFDRLGLHKNIQKLWVWFSNDSGQSGSGRMSPTNNG